MLRESLELASFFLVGAKVAKGGKSKKRLDKQGGIKIE
jgi:hypothetical protein